MPALFLPSASSFGRLSAAVSVLLGAVVAHAGVGDPQLKTDHPWYPGELAFSTFDRLRATEAEQYRRMTGAEPKTDEEKALAAWAWRNTHFAHGEEGAEDLWGKGFGKGDCRTFEYWTGLFADGFALCGTTHSQWTAEMEQLLGHNRGRVVGVAGHNSFEVFLSGGPYAAGKWALLDHDISTVIFDSAGQRLLSIPEVKGDLKELTDRRFEPQKQHGWLVCGLHPEDGGVYGDYSSVSYLAGYAGVPPVVHLRRGEKLRRYFQPGLEDGKTFVFWGRNYKIGGIPGPERSQTWVNQPEAMHGSKNGTGYHPGQARFANAVYTYQPDFRSGDYREGVIAESEGQVTFEFYTPYLIGATPPNDKPWGIYDAGGRNGLVLHGTATCPVAVSVDQGRTWHEAGPLHDGLDLTDQVKGHRQYFLRFGTGAPALAGSGLTITTVCQANAATFPRLKDGGTRVDFAASGRAVLSAGPNLEQARTHVVQGGFDTPTVTLELAAPRARHAVALYTCGQVASSNPPSPDVKYRIEYSADRGATWKPVVSDWNIPRRGDEPGDFWSQSFCYGSVDLPPTSGPLQVRFANTGGKRILRADVSLLYETGPTDATDVTFAWTDTTGPHQAAHRFSPAARAPWSLPTGQTVQTKWVEMAAAGSGK